MPAAALNLIRSRSAAGLLAGALGAGAACAGTGALGTATAAAAGHPGVHLGARCYLVGQRVQVSGSGFLSSAPFDITVDGVDFGQSVTSAAGSFSSSLVPGGLPAGAAQLRDGVDVSDGVSDVPAAFTLTRPTGAAFGAGSGSSSRRPVPFEVWDFAPTGHAVSVYLHYVSPARHLRRTVRLGRSGGQCGFLHTKPRQLFPFNPSAGRWTLQFDTSARYRAHPRGRVARIRVPVA